jgi:hypothetical protein
LTGCQPIVHRDADGRLSGRWCCWGLQPALLL